MLIILISKTGLLGSPDYTQRQAGSNLQSDNYHTSHQFDDTPGGLRLVFGVKNSNPVMAEQYIYNKMLGEETEGIRILILC